MQEIRTSDSGGGDAVPNINDTVWTHTATTIHAEIPILPLMTHYWLMIQFAVGDFDAMSSPVQMSTSYTVDPATAPGTVPITLEGCEPGTTYFVKAVAVHDESVDMLPAFPSM